MPKVSVIIPIYNVEKYLSRCLDSVCNQTLSDIEIICINDCSPDNSIDILNNRAKTDNRIKVIDFKQNQGVSVARNTGIEAATGEYIAFVDPDDYIDLDFYEKLYNKAIEENADIAKGDLKEILVDNSIKTYGINKQINQHNDKVIFRYSFTTAIYINKNIKKYNIRFNNKLNYAEDLLFLSDNIKIANKVKVVDNIFYYYDRREDSADSDILDGKKIKSACDAFKNILNNLNSIEYVNEQAYSIAFEWLIGVGLSFLSRNSSIESQQECTEMIFYLIKHIKKTTYREQIFQKKYSALIVHVNNNDYKGGLEFLVKNNDNAKILIASLRHNLKKGLK
jgi:glycosyltransferase involved in cell wall biosynthesis